MPVLACRHPARVRVDASPDEIIITDCQTCPWRPRPLMPEPRKLILLNHLSPGDVLVMTAAIRSLHLANPGRFLIAVDSTCSAVFEHSPDVVPLEQARTAGYELVQSHYPAVNQCNERAIHFMSAYCEFLAQALQVPVPLAVNRPQLWLSAQEKAWLPQVQEVTGRPPRPYWVLNAGIKSDYTLKLYPYYQRVVDLLQGKILFVQVGRTGHLHAPLRGVLDLIGKTDDRQLIRLVYHSSGVLSGVSLLMHLGAALGKPGVILAGGREPRNWNTYPTQTLLSTVGAFPCCREGGCWRSRVIPLRDGDEKDSSLCERPTYTDPPSGACMAVIEPEEVARAILRYS